MTRVRSLRQSGEMGATVVDRYQSRNNRWPPRLASGALRGPVGGPEQATNEGLGLEWPEVLDALADADIADRKSQLMPDGGQHAAPGRPIELRQDHAGQGYRPTECPGLVDGVLPCRGVHHE